MLTFPLPPFLCLYCAWTISLYSLNLYSIPPENRALQILLGLWLSCSHWQRVKDAELEGNCFHMQGAWSRAWRVISDLKLLPEFSRPPAFFSVFLLVLQAVARQCESQGNVAEQCPLLLHMPHSHLGTWRHSSCWTDNQRPHTYFVFEPSCCQVWTWQRISWYFRTPGCFWFQVQVRFRTHDFQPFESLFIFFPIFLL